MAKRAGKRRRGRREERRLDSSPFPNAGLHHSGKSGRNSRRDARRDGRDVADRGGRGDPRMRQPPTESAAALPADARASNRLSIGSLFVPHADETASSFRRASRTPFVQRVYVAQSSVDPAVFNTPSILDAVALKANHSIDLVSFLAWDDTTLREIVENVRRFYASTAATTSERLSFSATALLEVAAVFPGADGIASKAVIGTLSPDGPVSPLDSTPLSRMWQLTSTADARNTPQTTASSGQRLRPGDALLLVPVTVVDGARRM